MQAKRPSPLSPLSIVLPHPPLPRRSSSNISVSSSPRTPITRTPPICSSSFFLPTANRKSSDSWNSSNHDEPDCEWKPEQILLLSRTLDALPAHLLTPFHGTVPPSNLLDKIARGVANAKGPIDWPHSIRATRVKLMELARIRAKEATQDENNRIIVEEDDGYSSGEVLPQTTNTVPRRPLYRQSSMDFMNSAKIDLKDNDNITRLSNRLQRTDRLIPNPAYHPYSRPSLPRSPRSESRQLFNSHTPSRGSTLTSSSSSSRSRRLRRSTSTLSNSSDQYLPLYSDLAEISRMQRALRTDSLGVSPPNLGIKARQPLKRVPTFSVSARAVPDNDTSSHSSSDEEEKIRTKQAKKLRTKNFASSPVATPPPPTPARSRVKTKAKESNTISTPSISSFKSSSGSSSSKCSSTTTLKSSSTAATTVSSESSRPVKPRPKMNLQRNPSMFGEELPHAQTPLPRVAQRTTPAPHVPTRPLVTSTPTLATHTTGAVSPPRTLRRVRAMSFARAPARRISFSSLVPPAEDSERDTRADGNGLGSAFQLR